MQCYDICARPCRSRHYFIVQSGSLQRPSGSVKSPSDRIQRRSDSPQRVGLSYLWSSSGALPPPLSPGRRNQGRMAVLGYLLGRYSLSPFIAIIVSISIEPYIICLDFALSHSAGTSAGLRLESLCLDFALSHSAGTSAGLESHTNASLTPPPNASLTPHKIITQTRG